MTGGAIALGNGGISGSVGDAFRVGDGAGTAGTGGTSAITYSGSISKTDGTGQAVDIQDRAAGAGNITLSGNITHNVATQTGILLDDNVAGTITFSGSSKSITSTTATAVNLTDNAGATIAFTNGGLVINTTAGNGFNATGAGPAATTGGTVTVEGSGNTIASTTGTALNVVHTTIGATDLTFQSISANGGANGILLNNTGSSGGLTVTGNGANATLGGNGSGGTIQNATGDGISLTSTMDVRLAHMNITNNDGDGIGGSGINGFVLNRVTISGNGDNDVADESGINIAQLSGTASNGAHATSISNSIISNNHEFEFQVTNSSGTLTNLEITNSTISSNGASAVHGNLVNFLAIGTASMGLTVSGSTFTGSTVAGSLTGTAVNADASAGAITVDIGTSAFTNNNVGIAVSTATNGTMDFNIHDNGTITGNRGAGIVVFTNANATGTMTGEITDNTIGTQGVAGSGSLLGRGIQVSIEGGGTATLLIDDNTVQSVADFEGISVVENVTPGIVNATITDNLTRDIAGDRGIIVQTTNSGTMNANISGNTFINVVGLSGTVMRVNEGINGGTLNIVQLAPTAANVATELDDANGVANTLILVSGTPQFGQSAPPLPLLAAAGGVAASSPTPGDTDLSQAELNSVVAAAIAQWAHAGATPTQLAALAAITFSVADLSGNAIGEHSAGHIVIDTDAAGHGWYIDPTPSDSSEFAHAENAAGTDLSADPASAAAGHLDLLTAVAHEMGHELGLPDLSGSADAHELMYIDLADGERRLPDAGDVPLVNTSPLTPNIALGPLVAGTAGNDVINAGSGGNVLIGGAGADNFVFANVDLHAATPALTHVADYSFAQGDSFDFSAITAQFHGWNIDDTLVVRAVEDSSGSFATLQVNVTPDAGGAIGSMLARAITGSANAHWVSVAQLDGAHAGDPVDVLIDNNGLHHALVHVDLLV